MYPPLKWLYWLSNLLGNQTTGCNKKIERATKGKQGDHETLKPATKHATTTASNDVATTATANDGASSDRSTAARGHDASATTTTTTTNGDDANACPTNEPSLITFLCGIILVGLIVITSNEQ